MSGLSNSYLLNGDIKKGLLKLALPLMFLSLVNSLYNIVDTFWIGKMGELQVGAVALIGPIMGCGSAFITGLSAAGISKISMSLGQRNQEKANCYASHLFVIAILFGLLIGIVCNVFAHPILQWLETPSDIYDDTYAYLFGISFDFIFLFVLNIFQTIRQAGGDSKTAVIMNAIAAVLNMILDPIFIFTLDLGVLGAAIATVLSKVIVIPFVIYILFNDTNYVTCSFKNPLNFSIFKEIILVGIPASLAQFLSSFGFVLMNKSIVAYGSIAISAYGLGNKVTDLFYIPIYAFGGALAPFIGQNIGAKNTERAKECYKEATILTLFTSILVMILGFLSCKYLVLFFVSNASQELMDMTIEYCFYVTMTIFFMGWFQNIHGVFSGAGKTKLILYLSTFRLWGLRLPLIYIFYNFTNLGPTGIWWSMVISNFITCIVGQYFYNKYEWLK